MTDIDPKKSRKEFQEHRRIVEATKGEGLNSERMDALAAFRKRFTPETVLSMVEAYQMLDRTYETVFLACTELKEERSMAKKTEAYLESCKITQEDVDRASVAIMQSWVEGAYAAGYAEGKA